MGETAFLLSQSLSSLGSGILLTIAGFILFLLLRTLYNISPLHPLSHYPGPLLWTASRLPWIIALQSGHLHHKIKDFHDRYGSIVRIAPNELSYIDAQAWKDIYVKAAPGGAFERNRTWFQKMQPDDPWSIMGPDEPDHARYRRAFMGAFSDKALKEHAGLLEHHADLFVKTLKEISLRTAMADMTQWFNYLLFDITGSLTFGESFGSVQAGKAHPWVEISCHFGKGVALMASLNLLGLSGVIGPVLKQVMPKTVREQMVYHRQLTTEKIQQRVERGNGGLADFVDVAQKYNDSLGGKEQGMNEKEIELNMSILIFAGSETTSSALTAILRLLLQHRDVFDKVVAEVRGTYSSEKDIVVDSVNQLRYLTAVIYEGLRLGPPVVIGLPRVVPKGGAVICDQWVAGGTFVVVNQHAAYRSASNFAQPDNFMPERFLESGVAGLKDNNSSVFQPFSVGRHQCIGQRLAMAELRLILAKLLYVFQMDAATKNTLGDWEDQKTFIFWEKEALMVRLSPCTS